MYHCLYQACITTLQMQGWQMESSRFCETVGKELFSESLRLSQSFKRSLDWDHVKKKIIMSYRASSYEFGNRAGSVTGTNFVVCSYGKFQPGRPEWKCKKQNQNCSSCKVTSFVTIKAFLTLETSTNKFNSHTF